MPPSVCRLETVQLLSKVPSYMVDVFRFLTFLAIGTASFGEIPYNARTGVVWLNMDGHMRRSVYGGLCIEI